MRLRNEALRTGRLLAWFDDERRKNQGLIFLVSGADDIDRLGRIEAACEAALERFGRDRFEWHDVADQTDLSSVDPLFDPSGLTRVEAAEFIDLDEEELLTVLGAATDRMRRLEPQLFPRAGGAVGSPAQGIQLLARDTELGRVEDELEVGHSVQLLAPRRSGKSSLMLELERRLAPASLYLDVERPYTPKHLAAHAAKLALGRSPLAAMEDADRRGWQAVLDDVLVELSRRGPGWSVLLLDEPQALLESIARSPMGGPEPALDVLRDISACCSSHGVRMVVAGSVDLHEVVRRRWDIRRLPGLFGELVPFRLSPLDTSTTELRSVLVGSGLVLDVGDASWLQAHVDLSLPYPAMRFLDGLVGEVRRRGSLTHAELDTELERFLDDTDAFRDIERRAIARAEESRDVLGATRRVLNRLVNDDAGTMPLTELQAEFEALGGQSGEHLSWFEATFPVVRQGSAVYLSARMFRQWWERQAGW
jgi:hypothetical protein